MEHKIGALYILLDGRRFIGLRFPFDPELKKHVASYKLVRWSDQHRCYYLPNDRNLLGGFINHCRGIVWVDQTQLIRDLPRTKKAIHGTKKVPQLK